MYLKEKDKQQNQYIKLGQYEFKHQRRGFADFEDYILLYSKHNKKELESKLLYDLREFYCRVISRRENKHLTVNSISIKDIKDYLNTPNSIYSLCRESDEYGIDFGCIYRLIEKYRIDELSILKDYVIREIDDLIRGGILDYSPFFYLCRSNLFVKELLSEYLNGIFLSLLSTTKVHEPWRNCEQDSPTVDLIGPAAQYCYIWCRLKHRISKKESNYQKYEELAEKAKQVLKDNQLADGSWSWSSEGRRGDIKTTCFAIHALSSDTTISLQVIKPTLVWLRKQWDSVQKGRDPFGDCLIVDSIALCNQDYKYVSFSNGDYGLITKYRWYLITFVLCLSINLALGKIGYTGFINCIVEVILVVIIVRYTKTISADDSFKKIFVSICFIILTSFGPTFLNNNAKPENITTESLQTSNELYNAGIHFMEDGKFSDAVDRFYDAIEECKKASNGQRNMSKIYTELGRSYYYMEEYDKSIDAYTDALGMVEATEDKNTELECRKGYIQYLRANTYIKNGNYDKADRDLSDCIGVLNKYKCTYYDFSSIYLTLGNWYMIAKDSSAEFLKILNGEKTDISYYVYAYYFYSKGLSYKGAKEVDGLEISPLYLYYDEALNEILKQNTINAMSDKSWTVNVLDRTAAELLIGRARAGSYFGLYDEGLKDLSAAIEIYNAIGYSAFNNVDLALQESASMIQWKAMTSGGVLSEDDKQLFKKLVNKGLQYVQEWRTNLEYTLYSYLYVGFGYYICGEFEESKYAIEEAEKICFEFDMTDMAETCELLLSEIYKAETTGNINISLLVLGQ